MTFECSLTISGTDPQKSAQAFIDSYNDTSKMKHYQKYQKRIEQYFLNKIQQNISKVQIKDKTLKDSFFVDFRNNELHFMSTRKSALKYEFGSGKNPPKRYIQPSIIDTANEMSNIIIDEAINTYNRYMKNGKTIANLTPNMPIQTNYLNKYSKIIK